MTHHSFLLPFEEVTKRLRLTSRTYVGIQTIPLERIIGSVDRACEFDRHFHPRRWDSRARIDALRAAFPNGVLPAISVFEIGGVYFVSDGHHRVALAHERGQSFIEAEIVRLETNYRLTADVDIPQLIHAELRRVLLEDSGLGQVRPDIDLVFSNPAGYVELLESIKAYAWDLANDLGRLPSPAEVATAWLSAVYDPAMAAIDSADLRLDHPGAPPGDLFLWLYQRRRSLCASGGTCGYAAAAREAATHHPVWKQLRRALHRQTPEAVTAPEPAGLALSGL
ncbi:MAG TPA: hypothetical protein VEQ66_03450 [Propionibacteriaceae bacterium]|nr:hypothetical protein [Propionibacteriaceae bacterium]